MPHGYKLYRHLGPLSTGPVLDLRGRAVLVPIHRAWLVCGVEVYLADAEGNEIRDELARGFVVLHVR